MNVNTENAVTIAEAVQNFSRVAKMADESGAVVILKNNLPRYLLVELGDTSKKLSACDEDVLEVSGRLIEKNREAYSEW